MEKVKLSQWAKNHGVCYRTAWNYFKEGRFEGKSEVSDKGSIFVFDEEVNSKIEENPFNELVKSIQELTQAIKNKSI